MKGLIYTLALLFACLSPDKKQNDSDVLTSQYPDHQKKEVSVFIYHRFGDDKYPSTNVSMTDFERHLQYLKSNGFTVLTFGQAIDYISDPSMPLIEKVACISIDDAFKSFMTGGFTLLRKYGFPATLFANSETIGGGSFMTWDEIRKVAAAGIEIGNHTHSHSYYLDIPVPLRYDQFKADVKKCQEIIERELGTEAEVFAFPFGEFDSEMKKIIRDFGFKGAAAQFSGVMYDNDRFAVPRFPMTGSTSTLNSFTEKVNMNALRIIKKTPDTAFFDGKNPPSLTLIADTTHVDLSRLNCFIAQGCTSEVVGNSIKIVARNPLRSRRTNYTITTQGKNGGWYWHTHQWVNPNMKE